VTPTRDANSRKFNASIPALAITSTEASMSARLRLP
jgi:hypothetical protein